MNMFLRNMLNAYHAEAGEGDLPAGGDDTPQPAAKTYTQDELDELVAGLKNQNAALLDEKKKAAQRAKEQEAERIRTQQEAAKQAGEFEKFEQSIRGQYDPLIEAKDARISELSSKILGGEQRAVMGQILAQGKFIDADAADLLRPFVKVEFDGTDTVTKFVDTTGNLITTDPAQFIEYCRKHKVISHLMQADAATGGGASGGKGGGAAPMLSTMTEAERIELHNTNPAEFNRQMQLLRK